MNEEFKRKIIEDIQRTGFPSELKIASILKKDDWTIEQNGTYLDYETSQSREIDIKAHKLFVDENADFYFFINLIIEVKKVDKRPWIFFGRENTKKPYFSSLGPGFRQLHVGENFKTKILPLKEFMNSFPRNDESIIGTIYYEAFKDPDESSKIYAAILSAIKGAFHEAKISEIEKSDYDPEDVSILNIFMPVVVLDGLMFKAFLCDNETIELEPANYIPVEISHTTKPYDKEYNYYPEVMTLNYFKNFLEKINSWGDTVKDAATENIRKMKEKKIK